MVQKRRILIVDDEPINRLGLRGLLDRSSDWEIVAEAVDGADALEKVQRCDPDVVLLDIKMPVMDGVEAARKIRQNHPYVKIIMLSSVNAEHEVFAALNSGANGYCVKKSDPEKLFIAIKAVLQGDMWLDSGIASVILRRLEQNAQKMQDAKTVGTVDSTSRDTDRYMAISAEELRLLGLMVAGHSHEQVANILRVTSGRLQVMQGDVMNKVAVIESTVRTDLSLNNPIAEAKETMECPVCKRQFGDGVFHCPDHGLWLVPHKSDPFIGNTFADRFEILSRIGRGSGGSVYKARHKFMHRDLAIKIMHVDLMTDLNLVRRFRQEAEAAGLLDHPNIVSVLDFGLSQEGYAYMVMELVAGQSLAAYLENLGRLPVDMAIPIFAHCCDGLGHAHSKGLVHRDIKPSNVILAASGDDNFSVKIVDFGIVKMSNLAGEKLPDLTMKGEVFGTPTYMSPEQCAGLPLSPASDVYSWGVSLYQCLAGVPPFAAETVPELMYKHVKEGPNALCDASPASISDRLSDVVMQCLEKNPLNRFKSMKLAKEALLAAVAFDMH